METDIHITTHRDTICTNFKHSTASRSWRPRSLAWGFGKQEMKCLCISYAPRPIVLYNERTNPITGTRRLTRREKISPGSGEVRTRADFRPLGFKYLKSNALDQLGHATDQSVVWPSWST